MHLVQYSDDCCMADVRPSEILHRRRVGGVWEGIWGATATTGTGQWRVWLINALAYRPLSAKYYPTINTNTDIDPYRPTVFNPKPYVIHNRK